jgi:ABC-2 type transport system ATP-binding protein
MTDSTAVIMAEGVCLSYRRPRYPTTAVKDVLIHMMKGRFGFERFEALHDVSLRVSGGEVLGIVGANGAGKSTLVKVLAGILPPTSGRVRSCGRVAPLIELGAGFDAEMSARENIELYGALLGQQPREMRSKAVEICEWAGVEEFVDVPLRQYSSGMLIRLAFAIATDCDPDILLVDEVLAVGDEEFQRRSSGRINELLDRGSAVVMVSHALDMIAKLCTRAIWLNHGGIEAEGEPNVVIAAYMNNSDNTTFNPNGLQ